MIWYIFYINEETLITNLFFTKYIIFTHAKNYVKCSGLITVRLKRFLFSISTINLYFRTVSYLNYTSLKFSDSEDNL